MSYNNEKEILKECLNFLEKRKFYEDFLDSKMNFDEYLDILQKRANKLKDSIEILKFSSYSTHKQIEKVFNLIKEKEETLFQLKNQSKTLKKFEEILFEYNRLEKISAEDSEFSKLQKKCSHEFAEIFDDLESEEVFVECPVCNLKFILKEKSKEFMKYKILAFLLEEKTYEKD